MKKRLQVFISSTYLDLKEERQAAVSAILKSGHIPAGMELFTAGDRSQLEIIKRWIDESDVFMLILGGRYGSIESASGKSYTELEYDYALEIGKPLFAVVIKEDALEKKVKEFGTTVIEKDNVAEFKLFKEKVLSNMSSFFEDTKDIRLCVLESLPEIEKTRHLSGWVSGNEIPDAKGLIDEISRLNIKLTELFEENTLLKKQLDEHPKITKNKEFDDLINVLKNIEVTFPENFFKEEQDNKMVLLDIFLYLKEFFITGITNQLGQDNSVYFFYENICPKLQIYNIVVSEKVPNARYRRFAITKYGQDFLAYVEKKKILSKNKALSEIKKSSID